MLIIWKGRGLLTPIYFFGTFIGITVLTGLMAQSFGGFLNSDEVTPFVIGLGCLLAGLFTQLTSKTHKKIDGVKVRVKSHHSFFFIPMTVWSVLFYLLGVLFNGMGIYKLIPVTAV